MSNQTSSSATPKKILIVDDNEFIVRAFQFKLELQGYHVSSAMDGSTAISAIRHDAPDLILLDINFPPDVGSGGGGIACNGFAIMEWLQRMDGIRTIPIIIITGEDPAKYAAQVENLGAVAIFRKPIDKDELLRTIRGVFEKI